MIKNIFIIILVLGFIGVIIFLDIPMVQNILDIKKDTKIQQNLFEEKSDFIQTVGKLAEKYKGNESVFKELDFILPNDQDVPNLIVQLETLANNSGVVLDNVAIIEEEKSKEKTSDYGIVNVNLKLNSSYESFKNFLTIVENNMRLIDISSIDFDAQIGSGGAPSFDFNVILKTYYQIN